MPNIDMPTPCADLIVTAGADGSLPGICGHDFGPIFCDCVEHLLCGKTHEALAMIDALCDLYEYARNPRERHNIVLEIRNVSTTAIRTHNVKVRCCAILRSPA